MNIRLRRKYKIALEKSPAEIIEIIYANLGGSWNFSSDKLFSGRIDGNYFKIVPRDSLRNAFRPTLHGRIYEKDSGRSMITVDARPHPFVGCFSIIWLLGVCFFLISGLMTGTKPLILISAFFFVFYFVLSRLAFEYSWRLAKKALKRILCD